MSETAEIEILEKIIKDRRSIRVFDDSPVPEYVIQKCLDLAMLAPNSANLQPWEFYWIRSPTIKQKAVEACLSQAAASTAPELIAFVARTRTWRRALAENIEKMSAFEKQGGKIPDSAWEFHRKIIPLLYSNGFLGLLGFVKKILFFFIGLKKPMIREPTNEVGLQTWAIKTVALAAENFMLAARAQGFDTCPMEGFDSVRLAKCLKLPSDAAVVMMMAVGTRSTNGIALPFMRGEQKLFVKIL